MVNYYINRHNLKFQGDFRQLDDDGRAHPDARSCACRPRWSSEAQARAMKSQSRPCGARWATAAAVRRRARPAAGSAQAADVGARVVEALRERPRVRVIVALREPTAPVPTCPCATRRSTASRATSSTRLPASDFVLTHRWESLNAFAGEVTLSGLRTLCQDPDVLMVDVDPPAYADLAETAALIRVDQVRGAGITGKGVVVAVLDTGVDTRHPDLRDSLVAEQCFCTSASGAGCCPNGTAEQSGAGARRGRQRARHQRHRHHHFGRPRGPRAASPPTRMIVAIKVLDRTGAGTSAGILSGLDYVINKRPEVKVVNLSLGLGNLFPGACDSAASFTTAFAAAVNTLRGRGAVLFASSGNNGSSSQIAVPACIANAIAVGAVYKGDVGRSPSDARTPPPPPTAWPASRTATARSTSSPPGAPVTSAGIGGGVSTFVGTSQACPVAAGVAALILSARPGLSPDALEAAMKNTGVTDHGPEERPLLPPHRRQSGRRLRPLARRAAPLTALVRAGYKARFRRLEEEPAILRITVAIPCYNEATTIAKVVADFRAQLPEAEILVVDNASSDDSGARARRRPGARVVREKRRGKGYVMQTILETVDARRLRHRGRRRHLFRGGRAPAPGAGDRRPGGHGGGGPPKQASSVALTDLHRFGNRAILAIINMAFRTGFQDVLSGYRVMNRNFMSSVPLITGGFETETELTLQALEKGMVIREMPIRYRARPEGSVSKLSPVRRRLSHPDHHGRAPAQSPAALLLQLDRRAASSSPTPSTWPRSWPRRLPPYGTLVHAGVMGGLALLACGLVLIGILLNAVSAGFREMTALQRRPR